MKTLKDVYKKYKPNYVNGNLIDFNTELKDVAREWINTIKEKSDKHWEELYKKGYVKMEEPYYFELDGLKFSCWHEGSDDNGAIMILKHIFNLEDE